MMQTRKYTVTIHKDGRIEAVEYIAKILENVF